MQRHMISLTKRAHLFLKIPLRVVRFLFVDISHQRTEIRRADGKQTITTLPCEHLHTLLLHPNRRGCLQLGNNLSRRSRRSESQRKVHMVRNAACPKALAVQLPSSPRKISMQPRSNFIPNHRDSSFSAENKVNQIEIERLRHGAKMFRAFSPPFFIRHSSWTFGPGCYVSGPTALHQAQSDGSSSSTVSSHLLGQGDL